MIKVFPTLDLGDNIVLNGLCRVLARRDPVQWVAQTAHYSDIRKMYSDFDRVTVIDGGDYAQARPTMKPGDLGLGYFGAGGLGWTTGQWDKTLYEQAGVDFEHRWKSCHLPMVGPEPTKQDFSLIHEVPERDIMVSRLIKGPKIFITRRPSVWDWLPEILSASALHFVDSCFLNLAESLYQLGYLRQTRLVFHAYAKKKKFNSVPPILRAPWDIYER